MATQPGVRQRAWTAAATRSPVRARTATFSLMEQRVSTGLQLVIIVGLGVLGGVAPTRAAAQQGTPVAPPPSEGEYYVPPGYSSDPPPPAQTYPAPAQPYPAPQQQPYPQTQPYPQQQPYAQPYAQPYPAQPYAQPYADPNAQPYQGRRRLERLGANDPVPPGVEVIERRRLVLSFIGVGIFAGSYLLPAVVMIDSGLDSRRVFVPVVGALLENAHSDYLFNGSWGLAVLDAGVQAVGLTLFALGMRKQRYAVYYVDTGRGRTLALSPGVGPRGVSLHMAF